jgi:methylmalonyl-CoA mutase
MSAIGFEPASRDEWVALVEETLDGRTAESLSTTTADGIELPPTYGADYLLGGVDPSGMPGGSPYTRGAMSTSPVDGSWDVRALVADAGPQAANATALDELARGSTSLLVDPTAIGLEAAGDLAEVLDNVHLEMAGVWLAPGPDAGGLARCLLDLWDRRGVAAPNRRGGLGLDPLGVSARHGTPQEFSSDLAVLAAAVVDAPGVRAITVDVTPYAEAGASEAWELACSLATGVSYLRSLTDAGLGLDDALGTLAFTYSADTDQFATISKLRAARRLWDRVTEACGAPLDQRSQVQHVLTSAAILSRTDPWGNLLRNTVAAFSAGIGGARAITVRPFDSAIGRSDEFGRRTARNTQLLLTEEGGVARVVDPAGGSWYVEDLTDHLAEAAWERFRSIEADGGIAVALASGRLAAEVEAAWEVREARRASGQEPLIGVSLHADPDQVPLERPAGPPTPSGPMPLRRRSAAFEAIRSATGRDAGSPD